MPTGRVQPLHPLSPMRCCGCCCFCTGCDALKVSIRRLLFYKKGAKSPSIPVRGNHVETQVLLTSAVDDTSAADACLAQPSRSVSARRRQGGAPWLARRGSGSDEDEVGGLGSTRRHERTRHEHADAGDPALRCAMPLAINKSAREYSRCFPRSLPRSRPPRLARTLPFSPLLSAQARTQPSGAARPSRLITAHALSSGDTGLLAHQRRGPWTSAGARGVRGEVPAEVRRGPGGAGSVGTRHHGPGSAWRTGCSSSPHAQVQQGKMAALSVRPRASAASLEASPGGGKGAQEGASVGAITGALDERATWHGTSGLMRDDAIRGWSASSSASMGGGVIDLANKASRKGRQRLKYRVS